MLVAGESCLLGSDGSFVNEPILRAGSFIGTMRAGSRLGAKRLFLFMFDDFFFFFLRVIRNTLMEFWYYGLQL